MHITNDNLITLLDVILRDRPIVIQLCHDIIHTCMSCVYILTSLRDYLYRPSYQNLTLHMLLEHGLGIVNMFGHCGLNILSLLRFIIMIFVFIFLWRSAISLMHSTCSFNLCNVSHIVRLQAIVSFLRIPSCSSGFIQDFLDHYRCANRCRANDKHGGDL